MARVYQYDPPNAPIIGGHTCAFNKVERTFGRGTSMATTQRMLLSEPYKPTGDEAFDTRAEAFRTVLINKIPQAYEESSDGFRSVGL
jgi:hypothetical protein